MTHLSPRALEAWRAGPQGALDAAEDPSVILIYGAIGAGFLDDGVTSLDVIARIAAAGAARLTVRINSPGGDVHEGYAIHNALRAHPGGCDVVVDAIAASAAVIVAMAGGTIAMHRPSMLMIHRASTVAWGNAAALLRAAAVLEAVDGQQLALYRAKTGLSEEVLSGYMDAETYFTEDEALAAGLCDSIIGTPPPPPPPRATSRDRLRLRARLAKMLVAAP